MDISDIPSESSFKENRRKIQEIGGIKKTGREDKIVKRYTKILKQILQYYLTNCIKNDFVRSLQNLLSLGNVINVKISLFTIIFATLAELSKRRILKSNFHDKKSQITRENISFNKEYDIYASYKDFD